MSTHTSFISTLLHKKQQIADTKRIAATRVSAAKYGKMLSSVPPEEDIDIFSIPTPDVYMEGLEPSETTPIINQEGNIREHSDGSFSVVEDSGYVQKGLDEQTARSYGAYTIAKDKAIEEDAPEPGSAGDVANRLMQGTANIFGMGYKGFVGTGQTLRHRIDDYNSRDAFRPIVVEPGKDYIGQRNPRITEEDESRFNNIEQLPSKIQKLYKQSLKFKILTELKRRADETKEDLAVAEERVETVLEKIPVDRTTEAARDADFKYVAETKGLWEATKYTLSEDWTSYLYGGVEAIPYMAVLATGNVPAITSLVTSMAIGNNVENTKEFLRLNDGREPTQDEAARIQLFSVTQAAVDAIGDRLAVAGLPKAVITALSKKLVSAKKILASTAESVPSVFKNFAVRTVAKVATTPIKMAVTEAPAGIAEETSRQIATEGEISDPAAIVQAGIIEALAAPVAAPTVRIGAAVGKAVKNKVKNEEVDAEETQEGVIGVDALTDDSDPTYGEDGADPEFYTLLDSITGENKEKDAATLIKIGNEVLTIKQQAAHLNKIEELTKKSKDAADNANPTEDESLGSLENFDALTQVDIDKFNDVLAERSDSDQEVIKTLSNLQSKREEAKAKANTSDVSEQIRKGTDKRFQGADTFFSRIKNLVQEMVSAPDPGEQERRILTEENKLQVHAGNLEKKKEAFKKADNYVVDESKKVPESDELTPNEAIVDENGVKPRVGTGDPGDAIVVGVTEGGAGTGTTYTVYYNQSKAEIKAAKKEHPDFVTEVSLNKSGPNKGKSTINRLKEVVTADSDYVNSVATAATAYLKSELYANAKNKVEELRNNQIKLNEIAEEAPNTKIATKEATKEEIDTIDQEGAAALDEDESRQKTINVFWGQAESSDSTRILSNLAPRVFTYQGREYGSVEHAYQSNKSGTFDQDTYVEYVEAGGSGRKIQGKGTIEELKAADSLGLMKELVVESFKQNPDSEAAAKLMQYENFTHNNNELIDQAFLQGLKLAQESLRESAQIAAEAKEVDEGSQTTPAEENVTEEAPVAPEEQITAEVPIEELTEEEIEARRDALDLELKRRKEAKAAAVQEATSPVTEETEETVAVETAPEEVTPASTRASTTEEELTTYNNIKVVADDNIITAEGQKGAAQYDRKNKLIRLDRNFLQIKFAEKAWTKMRELIEDVHDEKITSKAENLPADSFSTYNAFEKFIIEHEYQHSLYSRIDFNKDFPNGTKGEYETVINNRALAALQQSAQESSEVSFKLDNNLSLQESELDVHTLSVLFPAAVNADGTLKTGDTADAVIGKLGKFLKVCE